MDIVGVAPGEGVVLKFPFVARESRARPCLEFMVLVDSAIVTIVGVIPIPAAFA